MTSPGQTRELLMRWHGGDNSALNSLLRMHLPWIEEHVRRRVGPALREKAETADFVQEALAEVLEYGPRFLLENRDQFRGLLVRIIENLLRDQADYYRARRRALHREKPLPSDTILALDRPVRTTGTPPEQAQKHEEEAMIRLALDLSPPDERRLLVMRQYDGLSYRDIAEQLNLSEDAARMRFQRALVRLGHVVELLQDGRLAELLAEEGGAS